MNGKVHWISGFSNMLGSVRGTPHDDGESWIAHHQSQEILHFHQNLKPILERFALLPRKLDPGLLAETDLRARF